MEYLNRIRKNHALEHATVAVLMRRLKPGTRIMGRSTADGFHIYSDASVDLIAESANEGLNRMNQGEAHLAVSPQCGTNLAVTALCTGAAALLALQSSKKVPKTSIFMATLVATVVAQPLGRLAQKYLTTTPDVADITVGEINQSGTGKYKHYKIKTLRDNNPI